MACFRSAVSPRLTAASIPASSSSSASMFAPSWAGAEEKPTITAHRTPAGVRFALLSAKSKAPAPTLFVFASSAEESLRSADYNKVGGLLGRQGYLCVSLDVRVHGIRAAFAVLA